MGCPHSSSPIPTFLPSCSCHLSLHSGALVVLPAPSHSLSLATSPLTLANGWPPTRYLLARRVVEHRPPLRPRPAATCSRGARPCPLQDEACHLRLTAFPPLIEARHRPRVDLHCDKTERATVHLAPLTPPRPLHVLAGAGSKAPLPAHLPKTSADSIIEPPGGQRSHKSGIGEQLQRLSPQNSSSKVR